MTADNAQVERTAALAAFAALSPDERTAVFAALGDRRAALLAADWTPAEGTELHNAFAVACACVTARYTNTAVPLAVLLDGEEIEHVVWALSEMLAESLRHFPKHDIDTLLRSWGAAAVSGLQSSTEGG